MRMLRSTLLPLALVAAAVLTGCGSTGMGDVLGGGRTTPDRNDQYDRLGADVSGTVARVSTRDRYIVVNEENDSRYNLRNGGQETYIYYDDRTTVDYQGRTYRPEDLEAGDRIAADTERSGDRLIAQNIRVLYDVTGGSGTGSGSTDPYRDNSYRSNDLRGTVSYVDTRNRTVEIQPSRSDSLYSRSDRVLVHYDSGTVVEFEGRRYQPENLERGDTVEVQIRDSGGQLLAERIVVTGENQPTR